MKNILWILGGLGIAGVGVWIYNGLANGPRWYALDNIDGRKSPLFASSNEAIEYARQNFNTLHVQIVRVAPLTRRETVEPSTLPAR